MVRVPRWVLGVVAAVVVAAVADGALLVLTGRGHAQAAKPPAAGVAVIDPAQGRLVGRVAVGRQPTMVAAGRGVVWVLNKSDGTVSGIDEHTRRVERTLHLPRSIDDITLGDGALWATASGLRVATVRRVDEATGVVVHTVQVAAGSARLLAEGDDALWTTGLVQGYARRGARSDPVTGSLTVIDARVYGDLIAADADSAYYVTSLGARVQRVDGSTGRLLRTLNLADVHDLVAGRLPPDATGVAIGDGSLWLSQADGTVLQIDLALRHVQRTVKACGNATAIAFGEGAVWVACAEGTAVPLDPATGRASSPVRVGGLPRGIAAGGGSVWVTVN